MLKIIIFSGIVMHCRTSMGKSFAKDVPCSIYNKRFISMTITRDLLLLIFRVMCIWISWIFNLTFNWRLCSYPYNNDRRVFLGTFIKVMHYQYFNILEHSYLEEHVPSYKSDLLVYVGITIHVINRDLCLYPNITKIISK